MTSVNVTTQKNTVTVQQGDATTVTVTTQGAQGATGAGITAGDKGALTVAANLTDWTLNDSIVTNAKVASDAAIAGSKISPTFSSQILVHQATAPQIRINSGSGDSSATRLTFGLATGSNQFINGAVSNESCIAAPSNILFGIGNTRKFRIKTNDVLTDVDFIPSTNDATSLGRSNARWSDFFAVDANISGNLTVSGTTTTIDTTTLTVEDKNIELGKVGSPTDTTADGGGISLLGDTTKTFQWLNATDSWTSSEHIALPDNKRLKLGADNDVEIYSNGSHGFIQGKNTQNGQLHLNANNILIKNAINSKSYIRAYNDGAVELYFDNVKKAETTVIGFNILSGTSNVGASIVSNASVPSHSYGHGLNGNFNQGLTIRADESCLELISTSGGQHAGSILIRDTSNDGFGFVNDPTDKELQLKSFTTSNNNFFISDTGANLSRLDNCIVIKKDGAVSLFHDGTKKAETSADGFDLPDNSKLQLGDSQDLAIFHDGSNSVIKDAGTGMLKILGSTVAIKNGGDAETMASFIPNGAVSLFHDNSKKLETTNSGITVTGSVTASTGILFGSDTADANTLNDYEEGTWTPTVLSEGNIDTPSYPCTYTKIGRLVTINADIAHLSNTTSSTFIKIGGLPYVPSGTGSTGKEFSAVCHGERYGGSATIVAYLLYNSGSWGISFRYGVPTNHFSGVRHSNISDDGTDNNLRFTLTYELV